MSASEPTAAAMIQIESGGSFMCPPGERLLRAALRQGLGFPHSCNVGSCGNCRFQLVAGEVTHARVDPPAWTDRDRMRGRWLGCQAVPTADCTIKVRLDPDAVPPYPPALRTGTLTSKVALTPDMHELAFAIDGDVGFAPGQYALLEAPGVNAARAYSMSNLPGDGHWRFLVKQVPGGAASTALVEGLEVGTAIEIDGPYGLAYLRERPTDLVLIAGGSGLSPIVSIARAAANSLAFAERHIIVMHGGRAVQDICGAQLLADVPGFGDRIDYIGAVSDDPEGWDGPTGFIHEVVRDTISDRLNDMDVYLAGPPPMIQATRLMLNEAGVDPSRIRFDEFY